MTFFFHSLGLMSLSYFFISNVLPCFSLSLLFNIAVCPDPGHLTNGIRRGKNFKNGSTVTFKCNANHDLIGNDTIRCEDKVWSGDVPTCKGAMQCEMFLEVTKHTHMNHSLGTSHDRCVKHKSIFILVGQ